MRVVIQRVSEASVLVDGQNKASIKQGYLILLGIENQDTKEDSKWLADKISSLRVFTDKQGVMNLSILDLGGDVIVVSQFTLYAQTSKGNRPSYIRAAKSKDAIPLYKQFKEDLSLVLKKEVHSGEFGSDMKVSLTNDGPVTIIIDTKDKQ